MMFVALHLVYAIIAVMGVSTVSTGERGTSCQACNCQINNVELLDQLIGSKIASGKLATTT